jgi:hypothetical protein
MNGLFEFENKKQIRSNGLRLNLHLPRLYGEASHYIGLVIWGNLAVQLHGCLSGDVAADMDSPNDYILYQWPIAFPWALDNPKPDDRKFRPAMRAALRYSDSFRANFAEGSLPELFDFNPATMAIEFEKIVGTEILDPAKWELSALDGKSLMSDITEAQSPNKGIRLAKRQKIA